MIMDEKINIRYMVESDIPSVLKIDSDAFPTPWTKEVFISEINNNFAHYLVIEFDSEIIGYCGLWVIFEEAQITNIAIHSSYRGKKFGEYLLRYSIELAKVLGAEKLSLEVRISNLVAQNLYRKLNFNAGAIRKNYYTDNGEDALVMWVNINE